MSQKNLLVRALAQKVGITQQQTRTFLDALQEITCIEARDENGFTLPGICRIDVVRRKARRMKNPRTGGMMTIAEHDVPRVRLLKRTRVGIAPIKATVTYETAEEVAKKLDDFSHPISFRCKKCGQEFEVAASAAGLETQCAACGATIIVPDESEPGTMDGPPLPKPESGKAAPAPETTVNAQAKPQTLTVPAAPISSAPAAEIPPPPAPTADVTPAATAPAPLVNKPLAFPSATAPAETKPKEEEVAAPAAAPTAAKPIVVAPPAPMPSRLTLSAAETRHLEPEAETSTGGPSPITPIVVPPPKPSPITPIVVQPPAAAAEQPVVPPAAPQKTAAVPFAEAAKNLDSMKGRTIRMDFAALGFNKPEAEAPKPPQPTAKSAAPKRAISFFCKNCHQEIEAEADMAGSGAECPSCGAILEVPFFSEPGTIHAEDNKEETKDEQKNRTIRLDFLNEM